MILINNGEANNQRFKSSQTFKNFCSLTVKIYNFSFKPSLPQNSSHISYSDIIIFFFYNENNRRLFHEDSI